MPRRPAVVLLAASETLRGVDPLLRRAGVRPVRLPSVDPRPVPPARWLGRRSTRAVPDAVVVTSRNAVTAGVVPWRRAFGTRSASVEFWAVGPETARALRKVGVRRVHRPPVVGARAVAQALGRSPRRTVLYFRSDAAGPELARALRRQGHQVVDLIVYRLGTPPPLTARQRKQLRAADLLVATSPSALSSLRRRIDRGSFRRLARGTPLVVLGERSRRAARGHGFARVSVAAAATAQRFTHHLLRELRDAPP